MKTPFVVDLQQKAILRWLPAVFWPRANWLRYRAMARASKFLRENRNEMSTNMASKLVKKNLPGISKDVTPLVPTAVPPTTSRCTNGRFGKTKQQKSIGPMRDGLKSWRLRETPTPTPSAKRKLVFESATDENEPPTKYQTRSLKVKYNSSSIALVHAESINRVRKSVNLNSMWWTSS